MVNTQYQYLQEARDNTQYQYQYCQDAKVNTQYQYQYRAQGQYLNTNTRYCWPLLHIYIGLNTDDDLRVGLNNNFAFQTCIISSFIADRGENFYPQFNDIHKNTPQPRG